MFRRIPQPLRIVLLALIVAWLSKVTFAADSGCHAVLGEKILGSDLASAAPSFRALPPDEPLGFAPLAGAQRLFRTEDLARIAARHGIELKGLPAPVCFSVPVAVMRPDQIEAAIRGALSLDPGKGTLEVVDYSRSPVPAGRVDFAKSSFSAQPRDGVLLCRGRVWYGERRSVPVWARVKVTVSRERVVAAVDLKAGSPISADQVRVETVEDAPSANGGLSRIEAVIGQAPHRTIRAGTALEVSMVAPAKDVERGDIVEVEVVSGAATLRFPAKADAGGRRGDRIVLVNRESGKRFPATIDGRGKATVAVLPDAAGDSRIERTEESHP